MVRYTFGQFQFEDNRIRIRYGPAYYVEIRQSFLQSDFIELKMEELLSFMTTVGTLKRVDPCVDEKADSLYQRKHGLDPILNTCLTLRIDREPLVVKREQFLSNINCTYRYEKK